MPSAIVDGARACPGRELRLADAVKEQRAPRGGALAASALAQVVVAASHTQ